LRLEGQGKIPWQQFLDAADGTVGDLGQDNAKVELRIETVQLRRPDQVISPAGSPSHGSSGKANELSKTWFGTNRPIAGDYEL
jgi:hypothetical protein